MLMRAQESPGSARRRFPGDAAIARDVHGCRGLAKSIGLPPAEVPRLRSEELISFAVGPIRGPRNTAGLTNAALYETAEGARTSEIGRPDRGA